ncbi:MAG TPA: hypothetical protein VL475_02630, partial [Planctomycetaceae bacterium]|nr:hypothetical protein [Planctomycetaceae bacterium]
MLMAGLLVGPGSVSADAVASKDAPFQVERIEVGLDGNYKVGEWTALRLQIRSAKAQSISVVVEAPDSDDNPAAFPSRVFEIPADESHRVETGFRTGRLQGDLGVRLLDADGRTLWQDRLRANSGLPPALRHDVPFVVTFAELPELKSVVRAGAKVEAKSPLGEAAFDPRVVRLASLGDLPGASRAMESVDLLILPAAHRSEGHSLLEGLTPSRDAVLREWVRDGGHLLISIAGDQEAYRKSPLADWVPVSVDGIIPLRQLLDLERFVDVNAPLRVSGTIRAARLGALPQRNVLVKEGGSPLIAALPYGFGRVTVIGLDLESPPLSTWSALPVVLQKVFGGPVKQGRQQSPQANRQLTQTGVSDLATQFQTALENFPAVPRPSYWWVMGLLVAYLLVIGPLDYLVVHRVFRRPELTWFTFALLVCLGTVAAAWGAARINDRGLLYNELNLVDFDQASKSVRGRSWVSLYSPENRRYRVTVEPALFAPPRREAADADGADATLSWSGVPENSVSGVYRAGGASLGGRAYRFAEGSSAVRNLPIPQWSTKTLCAAWSGATTDILVECRLESAGAGQLTGTITHHLPAPLEDCLFVVGGWAYFPSGEKARLPADVPWQPGGSQSRARDLKALLTGERRTKRVKDKWDTEVLTTTAPYNPLSQEQGDLIQMLSFHQVAGGNDYTGLGHAPLRRLELTPLMDLGRGILLGRMKVPAARVEIDGQSTAPAETLTYVRLIVPVQHLEHAPAASI